MTTTDSTVLCALCAQTEAAHAHNPDIHHEFSRHGSLVNKEKKNAGQARSNHPSNGGGQGATAASVPAAGSAATEGGGAGVRDGADSGVSGDAVRQLASVTSDPVLRMALIDRGVISTDDLTAAENKIAAMMGQSAKQIFRRRSLDASQVSGE